MRHDIFLAGLGGQGVLLAGQLLLEAAVRRGLQGSWLPAYMPEVRGGEATCTVVIADGPPGSPIVGRPHNLLLMDAHSVERYLPTAAEGALVIVNTSLAPVPECSGSLDVVPIPATELAAEAGSERATNMVMLGALLARRSIVPLEELAEVMREKVQSRNPELARANERALHAGFERAAQKS